MIPNKTLPSNSLRRNLSMRLKDCMEISVTPPKTNMTMEKKLFEDVFPVKKHGDVPASHVIHWCISFTNSSSKATLASKVAPVTLESWKKNIDI